MVFDPAGGAYIADWAIGRILYLSPPGPNRTVRLIAGRKEFLFAPDETPADGTNPLGTRLRFLDKLALDRDGSLLLVENSRIRRIRKIGATIRIETVAGTTAFESPGGMCPAVPASPKEACLGLIGFSLGKDGTIYFGSRVEPGGLQSLEYLEALRPSGRIDRLAGVWNSGVGFARGGYYGSKTVVAGVRETVNVDGNLYYSDDYAQIRRVTPSGVVEEVAGIFQNSLDQRAGVPLRTRLQAKPFAASPDGKMAYVGVNGDAVGIGELRGATPPFVIPVGDELHELDGYRRHISTRSRLRGTLRESFTYDPANGLLTSVTDADGRVTTIARTPAIGPVTQIVITSPVPGQVTTLALDPAGYLAQVTTPDGVVTMSHQPTTGLLTRFTDKRLADHFFTYDSGGRLVKDVSPSNTPMGQTLGQGISAGKKVVTHATGEGRTKRFVIDHGPWPSGTPTPELVEKRSISSVVGVAPNSTLEEDTTQEERTASQVQTLTYPDGTIVREERLPDPFDGPLERRTVCSSGGAFLDALDRFAIEDGRVSSHVEQVLARAAVTSAGALFLR